MIRVGDLTNRGRVARLYRRRGVDFAVVERTLEPGERAGYPHEIPVYLLTLAPNRKETQHE